MVSTEQLVNYQDPIHPCYVDGCETAVNLGVDQYCSKDFDGVERYRHLWHGTPSAVAAVGGGGGIVGYARTLEQAKQRAKYYIDNNPYAAPEVKLEEIAVLEEVERLQLEE